MPFVGDRRETCSPYYNSLMIINTSMKWKPSHRHRHLLCMYSIVVVSSTSLIIFRSGIVYKDMMPCHERVRFFPMRTLCSIVLLSMVELMLCSSSARIMFRSLERGGLSRTIVSRSMLRLDVGHCTAQRKAFQITAHSGD